MGGGGWGGGWAWGSPFNFHRYWIGRLYHKFRQNSNVSVVKLTIHIGFTSSVDRDELLITCD